MNFQVVSQSRVQHKNGVISVFIIISLQIVKVYKGVIGTLGQTYRRTKVKRVVWINGELLVTYEHPKISKL